MNRAKSDWEFEIPFHSEYPHRQTGSDARPTNEGAQQDGRPHEALTAATRRTTSSRQRSVHTPRSALHSGAELVTWPVSGTATWLYWRCWKLRNISAYIPSRNSIINERIIRNKKCSSLYYRLTLLQKWGIGRQFLLANFHRKIEIFR